MRTLSNRPKTKMTSHRNRIFWKKNSNLIVNSHLISLNKTKQRIQRVNYLLNEIFIYVILIHSIIAIYINDKI